MNNVRQRQFFHLWTKFSNRSNVHMFEPVQDQSLKIVTTLSEDRHDPFIKIYSEQISVGDVEVGETLAVHQRVETRVGEFCGQHPDSSDCWVHHHS